MLLYGHETDGDRRSAQAYGCVTRCPFDNMFVLFYHKRLMFRYVLLFSPQYQQRGGEGVVLPDFLPFVTFSLFSRPQVGLAIV